MMDRNDNQQAFSRHIKFAFHAALILASAVSGCTRPIDVPAEVKLTSTDIRNQRRAFAGAPPVIPHRAFGLDCGECHTETGRPIIDFAFAPANPHGDVGSLKNCRQCHLFVNADASDVFVESDFQPLATELRRGDRMFPGAPPTIPHSVVMRKSCNACHAGPSARPEIRCTHPDRSNCVQCHVLQADDVASSSEPFGLGV